MAGISTTGSSMLPSAQELFAGTTGAAAPMAADPAAPIPGPTVTGPGGATTTLPTAAPQDFEGVNPTPLDQPHPQYPALIQSHVAVLQAIGTPAAVIEQLNVSQPQAEYLDRYIQGEIMQNPEGWDAYVGSPTGTARAGLLQLMPDIQLPAPGQGNPGYMQDGSPVSGITIPGVSTPISSGPILDPTTGRPTEGDGLIKGLVFAAAAVGVGLLAWKFMKGRSGANETAQVARLVTGGADNAVGGQEGLRTLLSAIQGGKVDPGKLAQAQQVMSLQAVAGGGIGGIGGAGGVSAAATLESIMRGHGAANGFINSTGASAVAFNMSMPQAIDAALADRAMGVLEQMARNGGTVADLAAARVLTTQLTGAAQGGAQAATQLGGLRQALVGLANVVV
jgi:hypothetical protein